MIQYYFIFYIQFILFRVISYVVLCVLFYSMQALDLLKYSLLSKTTLTDLFLRKKKKPFQEMSKFSPYAVECSTSLSSFQIKVLGGMVEDSGKKIMEIKPGNLMNVLGFEG